MNEACEIIFDINTSIRKRVQYKLLKEEQKKVLNILTAGGSTLMSTSLALASASFTEKKNTSITLIHECEILSHVVKQEHKKS